MKLRRFLAICIGVAVLAGMLVACGAPPEGLSTTIATSTREPHCGVGINYDTYCPLNNSGGGPYPAIEVGAANSCITAQTKVAGRTRMCRVVDGYDTGNPGDPPALRDTRNFMITIVAGHVLTMHHRSDYRYGDAIVLYGGEMFEGCELLDSYQFNPDPTNLNTRFICDYRIRKPVITFTSNDWKGYVLHKAWDWSGYAAGAFGCATGIAGIAAGVGVITLPFLRGCADGPM